jgi:hypothetical protein
MIAGTFIREPRERLYTDLVAVLATSDRRGSAHARLDRDDAALVVFHKVAQRAVVAQQVTHLVHGAHHGNELRGETNVGFGLAALETIEALIRLPEVLVRLAGGDVESVETLVRGANLVADAREDLDGQVSRLMAPTQVSMSRWESNGQALGVPANRLKSRPLCPWPGLCVGAVSYSRRPRV